MRAPQKSVTWNAASIPALLLLGATCGSAIASTEIQAPCPESTSHSDVLHSILEADRDRAPLVRTVDGAESVSQTPRADTDTDQPESEIDDVSPQVESPVSDTTGPEYSTRFPGVSASDMPRFRQHMFRTDI
jgi:hypothetical protein